MAATSMAAIGWWFIAAFGTTRLAIGGTHDNEEGL
jgi:hypothetical protein